MQQKKSTYKFGIFSENIATIFLRLKGYSILKKRYKTHLGEVDIIAKKFQTLIAVEVKSSRNDFDINEVIRNNQKRRIINGMKIFMSKNQKYINYDIRFDVIGIRPLKIPLHLKNCWEENFYG